MHPQRSPGLHNKHTPPKKGKRKKVLITNMFWSRLILSHITSKVLIRSGHKHVPKSFFTSVVLLKNSHDWVIYGVIWQQFFMRTCILNFLLYAFNGRFGEQRVSEEGGIIDYTFPRRKFRKRQDWYLCKCRVEEISHPLWHSYYHFPLLFPERLKLFFHGFVITSHF